MLLTDSQTCVVSAAAVARLSSIKGLRLLKRRQQFELNTVGTAQYGDGAEQHGEIAERKWLCQSSGVSHSPINTVEFSSLAST